MRAKTRWIEVRGKFRRSSKRSNTYRRSSRSTRRWSTNSSVKLPSLRCRESRAGQISALWITIAILPIRDETQARMPDTGLSHSSVMGPPQGAHSNTRGVHWTRRNPYLGNVGVEVEGIADSCYCPVLNLCQMRVMARDCSGVSTTCTNRRACSSRVG